MQFLLRISEYFGGNYLTLVMLPIFRSASGDDFDDVLMSFGFSNRVRGTSANFMRNSMKILKTNVGFCHPIIAPAFSNEGLFSYMFYLIAVVDCMFVWRFQS